MQRLDAGAALCMQLPWAPPHGAACSAKHAAARILRRLMHGAACAHALALHMQHVSYRWLAAAHAPGDSHCNQWQRMHQKARMHRRTTSTSSCQISQAPVCLGLLLPAPTFCCCACCRPTTTTIATIITRQGTYCMANFKANCAFTVNAGCNRCAARGG